MSVPLRIHSDPATPTRQDAAGAWLDRVTAMLRVPAHERDAIRAELNEHLRERIRDLMLSGAGEAAATSQAISELGDAAVLARRYQEAIEPSSRRSLMHVGIATAATAALVISGATLFQNGSPSTTPPAPPSGNALVAAAPAPTEREASQMREIERLSMLLRDTQSALANQERDLARARGEAESLHSRLEVAEDHANKMQQETFVIQRQFQGVQEDLRRVNDQLDKVTRERDTAASRLKQFETAAATVPATAPVTYAPEPNPARDVLNTLKIADGDNSENLAMIMAQPAIRDAKVYLRNERLGDIKLNGSTVLSLPNRELSLGELLDLINATGTSTESLAARQMPDGRIAIDTVDSWDRASRTLVIYDLSDLAQRERARALSGLSVSRGGTILGILQVIIKTVTPDLWQDNGGEIGAISVLDSSLVVTAPERSHHQIRWIIEQVRSSSSRVEVPILSDLPLVDVTPIDVQGREISTIRPARKQGTPAPVEVKGEPGT